MPLQGSIKQLLSYCLNRIKFKNRPCFCINMWGCFNSGTSSLSILSVSQPSNACPKFEKDPSNRRSVTVSHTKVSARVGERCRDGWEGHSLTGSCNEDRHRSTSAKVQEAPILWEVSLRVGKSASRSSIGLKEGSAGGAGAGGAGARGGGTDSSSQLRRGDTALDSRSPL